MSVCLICGRETVYRVLFDIPDTHTGEVFSIGECPFCGVRKTMNMPADLDRYYRDSQMRTYRNRLYCLAKKVLLSNEVRRIVSVTGKDHLFVDIGCGTGDFSAVLHHAGCRVAASDSALQRPWMIEGNSGIPYFLFDYGSYELERMPRMDGCVILLRHVLEHLLDPGRFLRSMAGKGAEYFYILLPRHGIWEDRMFGRYYYSYLPPTHVWYFSPQVLEAFLRRCGLDVCARGFNIIPSLMLDAERFLRLNGAPKPLLDLLNPLGVLTTLSASLQFFLPRSAMWFLVRAVKK
jgi:SAM-dependent methyltransferase